MWFLHLLLMRSGRICRVTGRPAASPARQVETFLARFSPEVRAVARPVLAAMRRRLPGATELVYDNYGVLAIGFSPSERPSDAIFSIAIYPRCVNLMFRFGAELDDPKGILLGNGNQMRHIHLRSAATLDEPDVKALVDQAVETAETPFRRNARRRVIIRLISAKQRSRRPAARTPARRSA
jgi:hypothetical protein